MKSEPHAEGAEFAEGVTKSEPHAEGAVFDHHAEGAVFAEGGLLLSFVPVRVYLSRISNNCTRTGVFTSYPP